jgi:hypothetical protein
MSRETYISIVKYGYVTPDCGGSQASGEIAASLAISFSLMCQ